MNSKKIIIFHYDILFDILYEIKEKLNFDLIKGNEKNLEDLEKNSSVDYLIISKEKKNYTKNKLVINEWPIKIDKLLEVINLKFLKERFNLQSSIRIGLYNLNLNKRQISREEKIINLTEREINLILFLNKNSSAVKIDKLQKHVWEYSSRLDTHTVETHIYRLRKKIKEKFDDENFIISSKEGYFIN